MKSNGLVKMDIGNLIFRVWLEWNVWNC